MNFLSPTLTSNIGRKVLILKKNSPHIYFIGGLAGIITSTVLACRSTLKLDKVLVDFKSDIEAVKELRDSDTESKYPITESNRDIAYVYGRGTANLMKLYAPSILVGSVSVGLLAGSHISLTRRNNALTATVVLLSQAFNDYRDRVRAELGEEREFDIYNNLANEIVRKAGEEDRVIKVADPNRLSPYARFFDEYTPNWKKTPEYNRLFIQCQQNYLNNLLQARGHVFLNEAYDQLGIERSQAGQVVGWIMNGGGDNFIDFGLFSLYNRDFVNGQERSILLDFNVDGVVFDKI